MVYENMISRAWPRASRGQRFPVSASNSSQISLSYVHSISGWDASTVQGGLNRNVRVLMNQGVGLRIYLGVSLISSHR